MSGTVLFSQVQKFSFIATGSIKKSIATASIEAANTFCQIFKAFLSTITPMDKRSTNQLIPIMIGVFSILGPKTHPYV